jgi:molybdopterin-guanine dinucleotide biosynthesis protein A
METTVCILAGGKGGRIGGDKCLKTLKGKRLIDYAIGIASEVIVRGTKGKIVVSCRGNDLMLDGVEILQDKAGGGPMAGLHSCLNKYGRTIVFPCDMPLLPPELLLYLLDQSREYDVTVCKFGGMVQPQVGVYAAGCLTSVDEFIKKRTYSLYRLICEASLDVKIIDEKELGHFGEADRIFMNINTQEDLERAEKS